MTLTTQSDADALMMDALDGTISPSDRAALLRYLAQHPDEAAAFARMAQLDAAFRATPAAMPPAPFAGRVMEIVRFTPAAQPPQAAPMPRSQYAIRNTQYATRNTQYATRNTQYPLLTRAQAAYMAVLTGVVAAIGGILALAALSAIEPAAATQSLQALAAFASNLLRIARDVLQVFYLFARPVLSQPLVWVIGLGLGAIVLVWARVVAGVVASGLRARPQPQPLTAG